VNQGRSVELQQTLMNRDSQIRKQQDELVKIKKDYDSMLMTRLSEGTSQM